MRSASSSRTGVYVLPLLLLLLLPFSAADSSVLDTVRDWWTVWSTRILVTVAILGLWEIKLWVQRPQRGQASLPPPPSVTTTTTTTTTPKNNTHRSLLLDQLEEEQQKTQQLVVEQQQLNNQQEETSDEEEEESAPTNTNTETKATTKKKPKKPTPPPKTTKTPPPIKATTNAHPGMQGFSYWYDVETSLFRIYTLGRNDDVEVVPPYIPHSYRGTVSIFLHVTNSTENKLNVFWVDYKGKQTLKGSIRPNHVWTQTTWIDHPWVFEDAETDTPVLYYIPYRVIPTLDQMSTVNDEGDGQHQFSIVPAEPQSSFHVGIQEAVMPFPADVHLHTPLLAITWTLQHMSRMMDDPVVDVLQKYLTNIIHHPEEPKFRQLRIRSPHFAPIWQSPMRGLLLAVGFVEEGPYAELGCALYPLANERVQEVALLSYMINQWKEQETNATMAEQPEGADGFGRAGFGRAGTIN